MANEQNRSHWNQSGQTWVAQQRAFDRLLEPAGDLLLSRGTYGEGVTVLDLGCGYGTTTMAVAASGALVHGVDISDTMIAAARGRVPAATFDVADAETDALGGPYDAVISRFGVMFFDDPAAAFANVARHTRTGGRLTFVCWNDQQRSSAIWAGGEVLRAALSSPPPAPHPHAPGPFALADPDRTRRLLAESGWADISIIGHDLPCSIGWPDSDGVEERLAMVLGTEVGPLMRDQVPSDEQPALIDKARASLRQRVVDGAVRLDASVWLVTAIRE